MGKAQEWKGRRHRSVAVPRLRSSARGKQSVSHKKLLGERQLFSCNHPGCGATFEGVGTYKAVWERARKEGWRTLKIGRAWLHWCMWVHIPNDRALKDMRDNAQAPS